MELLDYIRKNYKTPNVAVLRALGANEELIEYLCKTPWNTNMKVIEGLISGGGSDEGKQGLKSVTISPAIQTTPALDSLFPIYWDDLTEEEKGDAKEITVTADVGFVDTDAYTITVTPTAEWYAYNTELETTGEKGEPTTFTANPKGGNLLVVCGVLNEDDPETASEVVSVRLLINGNK